MEPKLIPINDLLNKKFYIAAYQRGYRWDSDQVVKLLNDIHSFHKDKVDRESFFCLQPIVVVAKENGVMEVIDGQQRLTTIKIIIEYLNDAQFKNPKAVFSIDYETRPDLFAAMTSPENRMNNIDFYHAGLAYEAIKKWFDDEEEKSSSIYSDFHSTLINNVKVIWYEVERGNDDVIDIFTRLNIGKIPLTNAELIKALFLKKGNFANNNHTLNQLQIAGEWDNIEHKLHNDSFWYFLTDKSELEKYDNRIEFVFNCMKNGKTLENNYNIFYQFESDINSKDMVGVWEEIKSFYQTLHDFYCDRQYYHLVGFLNECGNKSDLATYVKESQKLKKDKFLEYLKGEIKKIINNINIDDLKYSSTADKNKIKQLLLLHNIITLLKYNSYMNFPFNLYKTESWDIEHIHPQTDLEKDDQLHSILWFFTGIEVKKENRDKRFEKIRRWIKHNKDSQNNSKGNNANEDSNVELVQDIVYLLEDNTQKNKAKDIVLRLQKYFPVDGKINEDIDSISNLALLDYQTNRSYKNALFPIKQKIIIEREKKGQFVPLCTKNLFLKLYSKERHNMMIWTVDDAEEYLKDIKCTLCNYLDMKDTEGIFCEGLKTQDMEETMCEYLSMEDK